MASQMLQLKSSYPASSRRPEREKATEVMPQMILSWEYKQSSWSARRSNSLQVASSEPVANALPLGKNWEMEEKMSECREITVMYISLSSVFTHTDSVDVWLVTGERLSAHAVSDVPEFNGGVTGPRDEGPRVWSQWQTHHISTVTREQRGLLTSLDVPQSTGTNTNAIGKPPYRSLNSCVNSKEAVTESKQAV